MHVALTETLSISLDALRANLMRSMRTMLGIIIGIAAVSLLVGGIGIMNIMLVSGH